MPVMEIEFSKEIFYLAADTKSRAKRGNFKDIREDIADATFVNIFESNWDNEIVVAMDGFYYDKREKRFYRSSLSHRHVIRYVKGYETSIISLCRSWLREDYNRTWKSRVSALNQYLSSALHIPSELAGLVKEYVKPPRAFEEIYNRPDQ